MAIDRIREITTIDDLQEVEKFNPFHDEQGKFTSGQGGKFNFMTVQTKDPKKQHMADLAIARLKGEAPPTKTTKPLPPEKLKAPTKTPKKEEKPKEKKPKAPKEKPITLTKETANEMREKLGQSRQQIGQHDYDQIKASWKNGKDCGYFQTGNSFKINYTLRTKGYDALNAKDKKTVDTMDKLMKPAPQAIKATRMAANDFMQAMGLNKDSSISEWEKQVAGLKGKVYKADNYSSSSYSMKENVFKGKPVKLNITAPKGSKMLISPTGQEAEIVFARGTNYKITGAKSLAGTLVIDCEIIPGTGVGGS
jgi:outer membrane biosynthesis protein TonB